MTTPWLPRHFKIPFGAAQNFEVLAIDGPDPTGKCRYPYALIVVKCPTDTSAKWAARLITNIAIEAATPSKLNNDLVIEMKRAKVPDGKFRAIVVSGVVQMQPQEALAVLNSKDLEPPDESTEVKFENLSVGACSYRGANGAKYVKVRFGGHSLQFYFNSHGFVEDLTREAVTRSVGGKLGVTLFELMQLNRQALIERAKSRPLNLCKIAEFAKHNMSYLKSNEGDPLIFTKVKSPADIADPASTVVTAFKYGYTHHFVVYKDKIYTVKGWRDASNPNKSINYNHDGSWVDFRDCEELDPDDQYVREKIERSIVAKL